MALVPLLVYGITAFGGSAQTTAELIKADEQRRLNACLEKQLEDPQDAYEDGLAWLMEGNRPAARYCTATALIEIGHFVEGADRLEALAAAPDGGTVHDRAIYLAQAGNAWLLAGLPEEAVITLTDAITISPNDAAIYLDRARAHLALQDWEKGEADLDKSLSLEREVLEAHLLRGEARFQQGELDEAMADVDIARRLDPNNIDALLLRGKIREAKWKAAEQ